LSGGSAGGSSLERGPGGRARCVSARTGRGIPTGMPASAYDPAELLAAVPVFAELPAEELRRVAELSQPRRFAAGEVVFREGDASNTCYVVRSGHARAIREHTDGRQIALATFGPGDIFGELAMFDDEVRSATVEAIEPLEALAILGPDMRRLMLRRPELAVALAVALSRRLRATNERLASQSFQTVQSRVANVLAQLVEQARAEGAAPDGDVPITATQADVAMLAGSSRESASRFLATLERAGVISQGRGRLVVRDPGALRNYVY
jgi:CRP-like cAMP-binding protein